MKYLVPILLMTLSASAVSAASVFLSSGAAQTLSDDGTWSTPALVVAGLGMLLTIVLRCRAAQLNR
ncbi:hypothetical protein [Xylophilus sp. GOD-11R]|uniref:hypothetical protein n=1 Tax=Xylophilus sp. GOD-11R TaxID=3089814 RepID=UPI00298BCE66|nr:hypothetical protein [Xylophilus sp. GOD-11R]WPB57909.1 hypothetical protein R9X41_04490 [Xylophilus sp. GOD-11R]